MRTLSNDLVGDSVGGESMSTALTSMAILKVNFDRAGQDILDNFVPFIADRVYHLNLDAVAIPDVRDAIRVEFGLSIPGGVLKMLTKRCAKKGLFRQEAGVLYPDLEKLANYDLTATRAEVRRQHAAVLKLGVTFARNEFGVDLSDDDFNKGLASFIHDNAAPLLATVVEGHPLAVLDASDSEQMRFLIGSFIAGLHESEPEGFQYLTAVVKGALLASALYFSDATAFSTRLDRLQIYADTTLLLRAVGACGPDLQLYASESIALAIKLGARLYCFRHTFDEILGVLDACEQAVKQAGRGSYGEATEYMLSAGWGPSDVIELKTQFESKLDAIGVRIREKPEHDRPLTLDEERLAEVLDQEIHYRNSNAKYRDVDSLTAIYRLRGGNEYRQLERCRAVFLTHNASLVRAARKFMRLEEWERDTIPLGVLDFVLTTLLWLKEPLSAPNLPDHAIIADCFAAMRPDDALWHRYVKKIDELKDRGSVTEDEYVLLRQSMPLRSLIVYETNQDPEAFSEGTVERVLSKARENIAREAFAEVDQERQRRTEVTVQLELAREESRRLRLERDAGAQGVELRMYTVARRAVRVIGIAIASVLGCGAIVGTILATPWPGVEGFSATGLAAGVAFIALAVFAGLSLYGLAFGGSLMVLVGKMESWITNAILRWMQSNGSARREADD